VIAVEIKETPNLQEKEEEEKDLIADLTAQTEEEVEEAEKILYLQEERTLEVALISQEEAEEVIAD